MDAVGRVTLPIAKGLKLNTRSVFLAFSSIIAIAISSTAVASQPVFEAIDIIVGPDQQIDPYIYVSGDGHVIGTTQPDPITSTTKPDPIVWSACSGVQRFSLPFTGPAYVQDISGDGQWIVGSAHNPETLNIDAFRMTHDGEVRFLGTPPARSNCEVFAAAAGGDALLCQCNGGIFRWSEPDGFEQVEIDGSLVIGEPTGISDDGNTIVGHTNAGSFRWTTGPSSKHVDLIGTTAIANAVSADGRVVVGHGGPGIFRWTSADGLVSLGVVPDSFDARARAVSGDGSIIVGDDTGGPTWGFMWDEANGIRKLTQVFDDLGLSPDIAGWAWLAAHDISNDGNVIVGSGVNPDGEQQLWRLILDHDKLIDQPDSDGDGVCDLADVCNGDDASGDSDEDGLCNDIDTSSGITPEDCPEDIEVEATTDLGAIVEFDMPRMKAGPSQRMLVTDVPSGTMFPVGDTTVSVLEIDPSAGADGTGTRMCTFVVKVAERNALNDASGPNATPLPNPVACFAFGAEAGLLIPIAGLCLIRRGRATRRSLACRQP